jgi:large subunit ribosomal protein L6
MSRVGKAPVHFGKDVNVSVSGQTVTVKGAKTSLSYTMRPEVTAKIEPGVLTLARKDENKKSRALHGLYRALINNAVHGVTKGFQKRLVIEGVGFRAAVAGSTLTMTLGFSHPAVFQIPKDVKVNIDPKAPNILSIEGHDKQMVGQVAAQIRSIKKPEPYKGTGIRYENEIIKRKAGKAAGAGAGAGAAGGGGAKK